jgi:magnesium chelatase family protein
VRSAYFARLSGPVLDRIDLVALALPAPLEIRRRTRLEAIREQVEKTRCKLVSLWGVLPGRLASKQVEDLLDGHPTWREDLSELPLSSLRARHKVLRVALTLSAWSEKDTPTEAHFGEALAYRGDHLGLGG